MIISIISLASIVLLMRKTGFSYPSFTNMLQPNVISGLNRYVLTATGNSGWKTVTQNQMSGYYAISHTTLGNTSDITSTFYVELADGVVYAFDTYAYYNPTTGHNPSALITFSTNALIARVRFAVTAGTTGVMYMMAI